MNKASQHSFQPYLSVFQNMGLADESSASLALRTQLLIAVKKEIERRNWTQVQAAKELGVKQPRISEIFALRIDKFSVELLAKYLFRLEKEVTLLIEDRSP